MSLAAARGLKAGAAPFEPQSPPAGAAAHAAAPPLPPCRPSSDLLGGLLDLGGALGALEPVSRPPSSPAPAPPSPALPPPLPPTLSALLGAGQPLSGAGGGAPPDAFAALAALQQQQLAAAALEAADPLVSLTNLLAAQQGLNVRVQEVLLLKQQLTAAQGGSPARGGGIRGTGPIANPLYK